MMVPPLYWTVELTWTLPNGSELTVRDEFVEAPDAAAAIEQMHSLHSREKLRSTTVGTLVRAHADAR